MLEFLIKRKLKGSIIKKSKEMIEYIVLNKFSIFFIIKRV